MRTVILPGMDGSTDLLVPFCRALPEWAEPELVPYPGDERLGYDALVDLVRRRIVEAGAPAALIAESFSGPIAIRIAADPPPNLRAVVLVATFATPPAPAFLRHVVGPYLFWPAPPSVVLRHLLCAQADPEILAGFRRALRSPRADVLSHRMREILSVDVRAELARIELPVLLLEGTRDRLVTARRLLALRPDLSCASIDAPHLILEVEPSRSAAIVGDFFVAHGLAPAPR